MELRSVVMGQGTKARWVVAHEELCELSRRRGELESLEGAALLRALRANVHRHLGFGSFAEYVERLFGYGRRTVDDKLRTAFALEELPALSQALRQGALSASAVREVARVATPETEAEWLQATRGRTVHQVERLVSGRGRGDRPSDAADPRAQRHVLRFEVSAETLAHVREAFTAIRDRSAGALDDDAALLLMARAALAGPPDDGRASYQVAITTCDHCRRGFQQAAGELIEVDEAILEMASCDAQSLGSVEAETAHVPHAGPRQRATQTLSPALRRNVVRRDHGRCVVPGCRHHRFIDVHHLDARADGGKHAEDNLVVLCSAHHRALHRGQLGILGTVSGGLTFRHADGTRYGREAVPHAVDANERAFRGLRGLGFGEKAVKLALQNVRAQLGVRERSAAEMIRAALMLLVPLACGDATPSPP
jgi:hypothetical protein